MAAVEEGGRPVQGQFNIYYRRGIEQPEYVPDFVAATVAANLLIKTKKAMDVNTDDVRAKAKAAVAWCTHATDYSTQHGGKPWRYLLIPHDAVAVSATLAALVPKFELKANLLAASENPIGLAKLGGSEPQLTAVPRRH